MEGTFLHVMSHGPISNVTTGFGSRSRMLCGSAQICSRCPLLRTCCPPGSDMTRRIASLSALLLDVFRRPFREPVTNVAVGQQICGLSRIIFQLLSQLANISPQIFQLAAVLRST